MYFESTQCCAVQEIAELKSHEGDPEGAMIEFCEQQTTWYNGNPGDYKRLQKKILAKLYSFYIFTGVVKCVKTGSGADTWIEETSYGTEFAAYIKKHKLGVVRETPGRVNRVNHPDHTVKVWVWAPSMEKMQAWWVEHQKPAVTAETKKKAK